MNPNQFDPIVRMRELKQLIGSSNATIYSYIKRNEFPKPVQISSNCVGWRLSAIEAWLKAKEQKHSA